MELTGHLAGRVPVLTPQSISPATAGSGLPFTRLPARATGKNDHKLTVKVLNRTGRAPANADVSYVILTALNGSGDLNATVRNGTASGEVAAGRYSILTYVTTPGHRKSLTAIYRPDVSVTRNLTLTLDARQGRRIEITADNPGARVAQGDAAARIDQKVGGLEQMVALFGGAAGEPVYVTPAAPAPGLAFRLQARLTRNGANYGSPYIDNVAVTLPGGIPRDPSFRAITRDMARVRTTYASDGLPACAGGHTSANWPVDGLDIGFFAGIGALPATRTEYFSPGVTWGDDSAMTGAGCAFTTYDGTYRTERFARGGRYARSWFSAPLGPGGDFDSRLSSGTLQLWVPLVSSATASSGLAPDGGLTGTTILRNAAGTTIGRTSQPGVATFTLPARSQRYTAVIDASRSVPYSDLAVRQRDVWTFTSKQPGGTPTRLARLRRITLRVSFDNGSTPVRWTRSGWVAEVTNPSGTAARFASLRVTAEDTGGRTADQTIIHAYAIGP